MLEPELPHSSSRLTRLDFESFDLSAAEVKCAVIRIVRLEPPQLHSSDMYGILCYRVVVQTNHLLYEIPWCNSR